MSGHTNLFRRGAVYYYRARVPNDIAKTYGKTEVKFSLNTKDHKEAIKCVRKESARIENQFEQHREELKRTSSPRLKDITSEQLKHIHDVYYQYRLEEDEETRLEGFYRGTQRKTPTNTFSEYTEIGEALTSITKSDYAQGVTEGFYEGEAIEVMSWPNVCLNIEEGSLAHKKISRTLQEVSIRAQKAIGERNEGSIVETPETPKASVQENSNAPLLSEVMKEWIEDKSKSDWTPNTAKSNRIWAEAFIEITGDRPIGTYGKADVRTFKKALEVLPPNWRGHKELRHLTITEAINKAVQDNTPAMSAKTARKNFQFVGNLWRWSLVNYDEIDKDIFTGFSISVKSNKRTERSPFNLKELNVIFSSPTYTGCLSKNKTFMKGTYSLRGTAKHWAPLIALYTGMRLGEILQLHTEDIKEEGGIPYFDINDHHSNKKVKTSGSNRVIPIHTTLINLGFLKFTQMRKDKGDKRLFPEVTLSSDGTYSDKFSRYFSRFLEAMEIKHDKNSFHSFRHTFEDACRENDIPKEIMDALQGHSSQDMSGRYGAGYSVQKLNEWLQKIKYRGLTSL